MSLAAVKDFAAGGVGGLCAVSASHPFDTIKVRLQAQSASSPVYSGTIDCLLKTIKNESFLGLYKGIGAPLITITPVFAVAFTGYGIGKKIQQKDSDKELSLHQIFNAGMLSGVCTSLINAPGERVKCLLQIQTGTGTQRYTGPLDCARQLFREGGLRSVYRGTMITFFRDIPAGGIYFTAFEGIKRLLSSDARSSQLSLLRITLAGGVSGVIMWASVMPIDTLKSRLQTAAGNKMNSVGKVYRDLVQQQGILALYRGTVPTLLRAFPGNAACFLGFEITQQFLVDL